MRFGLFYEHQMARPFKEGDDERLLNDALDQVELADRLGYDYIWEVEHHFLEEYSHSSAPEIFLAAASQRTRNIRLGHGIVQLPPAINHPARVAERIASLDLISGGRVEFGSGEGGSQAELGAFGVPRDRKRAQWEECLDAVTRMFVERPFAGYEGQFLSMPPRNVLPHPKQKPHPPLWVACSRRDTILMAAKKGIGALSFSFVEPEKAKEWVDEYYDIIQSSACVPAGFAVNPNVAVVVPMMCHEDEATAIERGIDGAHFFGYALGHYYTMGQHRPGKTSIWEEFQANRDRYGFAREIIGARGEPLGLKVLEHGLGSLRGAIGTPAQIVELVRRYEAAGVDQVIFLCQSGRTRHDHICESLGLFAKEVMPHFSPRAAAREAKKAQRLAAACEAALGRRLPPRVAPDGYVIAPLGEPTPAAPGGRARATGARGGLWDALGRELVAALGRSVATSSDDELRRVCGNRLALATMMEVMASRYKPGSGRGFTGRFGWDLDTPTRRLSFTLHIDGKRARVFSGGDDTAGVRMQTDVATFVRILAGEVHPGAPILDGRLSVEGDLGTAVLISDLFEGVVPT